MAVSNLVAIILSTAATLHAQGKTNIASAADAAEALRPIAGQFAFVIFSLGIIGTGLLSVPVLAGSAAYALGESQGWKCGLEHKPWEATGFYGVIAAATLLGIGIDFSALDSRPGTGMECRDQWLCRGSDHGCDDVGRQPALSDGTLYGQPADPCSGMGDDGRHGGRLIGNAGVLKPLRVARPQTGCGPAFLHWLGFRRCITSGRRHHMTTSPRRGMPSPRLQWEEFRRRYLQQFVDLAFDPMRDHLERVALAAFDAYSNSRKAPLTRKAGHGLHDPDYDLSVDWIDASKAIETAMRRHNDPALPPRILLVNCSPRSEHTCPSEMSKSWRLVKIAQQALAEAEVEILDLSRLASEYGRHIYPCKNCFSTSPALCHWPCSCYPNHSLGQTQDWMNDIYPMWVAAHGIMIVTPVNWYQASSPLKLMIDRLVCADGGNPDPTLTHGKDAAKAQQLEFQGWDYPQHLSGRFFGGPR